MIKSIKKKATKKKATRLVKQLINEKKMFRSGVWDLSLDLNDDTFYPTLTGVFEDFPALANLLEFSEPIATGYDFWTYVNIDVYDDRICMAFDDLGSAKKFIKHFKLRVNTISEKQSALEGLRCVEKFMKMCDNIIVESGTLYGKK